MSTKKISQSLPKVAVITRTRNRPELLRRAILSLAEQTYNNYVHIVINDGGDPEQVESLVNRLDDKVRRRVQVIHNRQSYGLVATLNKAIRRSSSEYIAILDDDDTWHEDRLQKTIPFLDQSKKKAVIVKMDIVIEEMIEGKIKIVSQELHPQSGEGEVSLYRQCHQNYLSNGVITYRREVYDELGGYDESLPVGEDWDFGIRLMMKYDVAFLRDEGSLFYYHQRPKQKGSGGNSVHANVRQQEETVNAIRNRYLRKDLESGVLGVGYIMNNLEQERVNLIRLEGHINNTENYTRDNLKAYIREEIRDNRFMIKLKSKVFGKHR
jgi:glycosyltransferase involved in cell wall biosynthesis